MEKEEERERERWRKRERERLTFFLVSLCSLRDDVCCRKACWYGSTSGLRNIIGFRLAPYCTELRMFGNKPMAFSVTQLSKAITQTHNAILMMLMRNVLLQW